MSGGMRCKAQTAAILGVSRGFVTQQRARQAPQKFKLVMAEHLRFNLIHHANPIGMILYHENYFLHR